MRTLRRVAVVMLLVGATNVSAPAESRAEERYIASPYTVERLTTLAKQGKLDASIQQVGTHITGSQGRHQLNIRAARKAGSERAVVDLTEQLVAANNHMVSEVGEGIKLADVDLQHFPLVVALLSDPDISRAQAARPTSDEISLQALQACGTKSDPIPASNPKRVIAVNTSTKAEAEKYFRDVGYHRTAAYACGATYKCTHDWTRGRAYNGKNGKCKSPRFRDHGVRDGKNRATAQFGEPNPEIHSYSWPYVTWPSYVKWWHKKF